MLNQFLDNAHSLMIEGFAHGVNGNDISALKQEPEQDCLSPHVFQCAGFSIPSLLRAMFECLITAFFFFFKYELMSPLSVMKTLHKPCVFVPIEYSV